MSNKTLREGLVYEGRQTSLFMTADLVGSHLIEILNSHSNLSKLSEVINFLLNCHNKIQTASLIYHFTNATPISEEIIDTLIEDRTPMYIVRVKENEEDPTTETITVSFMHREEEVYILYVEGDKGFKEVFLLR